MRLSITKTKSNTTYCIIKDYTNIQGKRSTYIYEALGNDADLQKRFGNTNTLDKVKEYINSLNHMVKEGRELPIHITLDPNKQIEKDENRIFFSGHLFLRKIYYDLGINKICENIKNKYKFTFDLSTIVECLVFARIIWPSSKLLSYLAKELDTIQKELFDNSNKVIDRNYKVIYYDCTNYSFYTEEDDFKRYGISKNHMPLPLVQMGLFMDADGYPFAMNINPGNTSESKTMIPTEKEFLDKYHMNGKNIIVCTDAAMCNDDIKKFNVEDGRGFVITQSIKKLKGELKDFALNKTGWRILGNIKNIYDLEEIEKDESLKKEHYNTIFYKEIECETKSVKQTLIVTFSFKYQEYQHNLKAHQLERARILVDEVNKKNKIAKKKKDIETIRITKNQNDPKRFIKQINTTNSGEIACNIKYIIDETIYNEEEKYNGFYGITTNLIDDTETIIKVIKGRWEIEESFKIMKNDFDSGTVYLSKEDRIKGHFITCYLALFIYRYLEHKLNDKYTVFEIVKNLQEMKMLEQKGKGFQPTYTRNDLTDDLHQFLGINTDNEIITYKKIKKILEEQEK